MELHWRARGGVGEGELDGVERLAVKKGWVAFFKGGAAAAVGDVE